MVVVVVIYDKSYSSTEKGIEIHMTLVGVHAIMGISTFSR